MRIQSLERVSLIVIFMVIFMLVVAMLAACGHGLTSRGGPVSPSRTEISIAIADFFDRHLK